MDQCFTHHSVIWEKSLQIVVTQRAWYKCKLSVLPIVGESESAITANIAEGFLPTLVFKGNQLKYFLLIWNAYQ